MQRNALCATGGFGNYKFVADDKAAYHNSKSDKEDIERIGSKLKMINPFPIAIDIKELVEGEDCITGEKIDRRILAANLIFGRLSSKLNKFGTPIAKKELNQVAEETVKHEVEKIGKNSAKKEPKQLAGEATENTIEKIGKNSADDIANASKGEVNLVHLLI